MLNRRTRSEEAPKGPDTEAVASTTANPCSPSSSSSSAAASSTKLLPYDPKLLNAIESSFQTSASADPKRITEFRSLGEAISVKFSQMKARIARFASTWDAFTQCVLQNKSNPLRVVAAAVILINNNNRGWAADGIVYEAGLSKLSGFCAPSDDDGSFPNDLVNAWGRTIADFRSSTVFNSFEDFVASKRLQNSDEFPVCRLTKLLAANDLNSPLHRSRFLDSGVWVNQQSLLRRCSAKIADSIDTQQSAGLISNFSSRVPSFICGESGSGKTCAAMLAGSGFITLYNHARNGMTDVSSAQSEDEATNRFVGWIAECLHLDLPPCNGKLPDIQSLASKNVDFDNAKIHTRWPASSSHDKSVLVVFDECGAFSNLRHCFCRLWSRFRTWLAELLCCADEEQIYLVVIGTGTENFEDPPGSLPSSYRVFTPRTRLLFADFLLALKSKNTALAGDTAAVTRQAGMKLLADVLLQVLYRKKDSTATRHSASLWEPVPSDPATHRFLQLVSNPRCAALAVKQMESTVAQHISRHGLAWTVSLPAAVALLPAWSNNIAWAFGEMNGLAEVARTPKEKLDLIGATLYVVLTNASTLDCDQREVLSNKTGLLADTGFWIKETEFDEKKYEKVPKVTRDIVPAGPTFNKTERHVYVFVKAMPRFVMSKSFVALYLLGAGSILSSGCSIVGADWNPFAAATADYIMLCWLLNVPAPNPASFVETRSGNKSMSITYPAAAFALRNNNNSRVQTVWRGILKHSLHDHSLNDEQKMNNARKKWFEKQKEQWKRMIVDENCGIVFENISNAPAADLFALSPSCVTLIQCKYHMDTTLGPDDTASAFDKLLSSSLDVLEFLCECVGATEQNPCEVVAVLALGRPPSLNCRSEELFVNRPTAPLPKMVRTVTRLLTVAFEKDTINTPSFMFPVLQYPSDDQAAMNNATVRAVPEQEFVSQHAVINTPPQEVCARFLQKLQKESNADGAQK